MERSGTPGSFAEERRAREVGDSPLSTGQFRRLRYRTLSALDFHPGHQPGVPLLHPRLYASARYAGLERFPDFAGSI